MLDEYALEQQIEAIEQARENYGQIEGDQLDNVEKSGPLLGEIKSLENGLLSILQDLGRTGSVLRGVAYIIRNNRIERFDNVWPIIHD